MKVFNVEEIKNNAKNNFLNGYNCSQSVVLAFKNYFSLNENEILKLSSPFGGGICRLREMCGAVSGALIVLGLLKGYSDPNSYDDKVRVYTIGQELIERINNKYGSIQCKFFLNKTGKDSPIPEKRTEEFYKKRPCLELISGISEILANFLNELEYKS